MRVLWPKVIFDLEQYGLTRATIAVHCEVSIGTLYNWDAGREPLYHNGQRLLDLYIEKIGREPPVEEIAPYRRSSVSRSTAALQTSLPST